MSKQIPGNHTTVGLWGFILDSWVSFSLQMSTELNGEFGTFNIESIGFQVDVLVAGFPCVNLSMLTTTPGSVEDEGCQTGSGFKCVVRYCKRHRPPALLLENVASLFTKRKTEGGLTPYLVGDQMLSVSIVD